MILQSAIRGEGEKAWGRSLWLEMANDGPGDTMKMGTYGIYEDEFAKEDGQWLISKRRVLNEFIPNRGSGPNNPVADMDALARKLGLRTHPNIFFWSAGLMVVFLVVLRIPLRTIRHGSTMAMLVCVILLVLVLTPLGTTDFGAQSWFKVGPASFQPIEPAKLALALWGAHVLVTKRALLEAERRRAEAAAAAAVAAE